MLALFGIGAVAAIWWLGRLMGGPLAAALAGLLAAGLPAGIDESTFIWNPNPIPARGRPRATSGRSSRWRTGPGALVAARGRRRDGHDAVPRPGRRDRAPAAGAWIAALVPPPARGEPIARGTAPGRRGGAARDRSPGYLPLLLSRAARPGSPRRRASSTTSRAAAARRRWAWRRPDRDRRAALAHVAAQRPADGPADHLDGHGAGRDPAGHARRPRRRRASRAPRWLGASASRVSGRASLALLAPSLAMIIPEPARTTTTTPSWTRSC